ncbi:MAG: GYF domain-containing protein [Byssovorax sp.]
MTTTRDEWRWTDDRGVQRLVGTDELRAALASSLLPATTLVWRDGMKEWAPAAVMPELADAVAMAPKSPPAKGRASLVGITQPVAEEGATNGSPPPRPKSTTGGPLVLPGTAPKRPPTTLPRPGMRTLIGVANLDLEPAVMKGAPIAVPSPSTARVAITQIPEQGTTPARIDALEIPRAPALPGGGARPAPQRKMTTREIDGRWSSPDLDSSDEDATQPLMTRPTRSTLDKGSNVGEALDVSLDEPDREDVKPALPVARTPGSVTGAIAAKTGAPRITAPTRPPALPVRPALHRPPVATRPPTKPPTKLTVTAPGTKPFVFPSAPTTTPSPPPVVADATIADATVANATNGSAPKGLDTTDVDLVAGPPIEGPEPAAAALPAVSSEPILPPLDATPLSPLLEVAPRRISPSSHPPPARISYPPPLPNGVTITTTALFPTAAQTAQEAPAERATHPSYPPPKPIEAHRPPTPSRPPPPSIEPVHAAPPQQLAPVSAGPHEAAAPGSHRPPPLPTAQVAPSTPPPRARVSDPPPSTVHGGVAVPVGSLYGAGGALICMVVTAFFAGRCSVEPAPQIARPQLQSIPTLARAVIPSPPKACWVTRQPVMWAPKASKTIPFEVTATTSGALAIGYARDASTGMGIVVSPSTGEVKPAFTKSSDADLDRVTPSAAAEFHLVTAPKEGAIASVIPVEAKTPFVIGVQAGSIVTADNEAAATTPLWPLAGSEAPSAARVQVADGSGYALVFRRDGAIWSGWIGLDRKPVGELVKVVGSGGQVGKPNVGWNHRELALIFADKPAGSDHYEIRVAHAKTGSIPAVTTVIPLPKGGPGGDAFAPDIAGLPDGRWVMVWTEGASGSRAIRAQTLEANFTPLGDPIALSPPAGNFGQGVLGVVSGYAAAVFLSKGASSYELWGSVLQCG